MKPARKIGLAVALLVVPAGVALAVISRLDRPARLPDVVEPITIVDAISWDDGGSYGLAFRDARGVTRYACLMDDLEDHHNLVVGSYSPVNDEGRLREHPVGGYEERAFRQLLERWCRSDPDARWWDRRLELYKNGQVSREELSRGAPSGTDRPIDAEGMAVSILRQLRQRHRGWP